MKCNEWSCPNRNEMGYCRVTACTKPKKYVHIPWIDGSYFELPEGLIDKKELIQRIKVAERYNNTPFPNWAWQIIKGM